MILTHLLSHDAVDDEVVEALRQAEMEYFTLLEKIRILEHRVNIDEKTNLLKYRDTYLSTIIKTASRVYHGMVDADYQISFLRVDIDDFSKFNNTYGHDVGDKILVEIAQIIRDASRPTDYVIRFGGEEIDVILPATSQDGAVVYLQRLLEKIRLIKLLCGKKELSVTVSAGLTFRAIDIGKSIVIHESDMTQIYSEIQHEADDALYEAKYKGKDRFCVFDPDKKDEYVRMRELYVKK
jgi:diguanylate cyclase (GGDEF)-like protein